MVCNAPNKLVSNSTVNFWCQNATLSYFSIFTNRDRTNTLCAVSVAWLKASVVEEAD